MKFNTIVALACCAAPAFAFQTISQPVRTSSVLSAVSDIKKAEIKESNRDKVMGKIKGFLGGLKSKEKISTKAQIDQILADENFSEAEKALVLDKIYRVFDDSAEQEVTPYVGQIGKVFPGALSNSEITSTVVPLLAEKGFTPDNTLLATSLCCDELARQLEDDFNQIYGNNFNLGGLAGFPFGGNTAFGAMSAHIPDDGSCLIVYGPHVGISKDGTVGKVERVGIELLDNCCGSAIAASSYVKGITDGDFAVTTGVRSFTDFQQGAVQQMILPHGNRLSDAKDRMVELPLALYDSQDVLMKEIVKTGSAGGKKNGYAVLGGIQINTAPDTLDYFLPLRFELVNTKGEVVENLLPKLK